MPETFLTLLVAHLVADFPFQPDWMIHHKKRPYVLALHTVIVVAMAALALGAIPLALLAILGITHLAMDSLKAYALGDSLRSFLIDQAVHVGVILGLAYTFPYITQGGWWDQHAGSAPSTYYAGLCLLSGLILSIRVGAILIRKATAPFTNQIPTDIEGLTQGGYYIGCLERALVMLLVLIGQPEGIAFLVTAKSILRFGEIKDSQQRKLTEYIIIGNFMSFGWGLLIALGTQCAVRYWWP